MEKHWTTNGSGQHNIFLFVMNFIHSLCSNPISFQFNLSQYVFRRSKVWVCYVIRRDPYSGCIGCECVLSGNTPFNYSVTSRHNDSFCYVNTTGAQKNKWNRFVPEWNITLKCLWSLTKWHFVSSGLCVWAHNVAIGSNRQQSSTMCVCVCQDYCHNFQVNARIQRELIENAKSETTHTPRGINVYDVIRPNTLLLLL